MVGYGLSKMDSEVQMIVPHMEGESLCDSDVPWPYLLLSSKCRRNPAAMRSSVSVRYRDRGIGQSTCMFYDFAVQWAELVIWFDHKQSQFDRVPDVSSRRPTSCADTINIA